MNQSAGRDKDILIVKICDILAHKSVIKKYVESKEIIET